MRFGFDFGLNSLALSRGGEGFTPAPESLALFEAFTGSPTQGQLELYDGLIRSLIDFDLWDKITRLLVRGNLHSAADANIDWKTATVIASRVGTPEPTWTAGRGDLTDGTQNYVDTGINANIMPQDSAAVFSWGLLTPLARNQCGWNDGTDATVLNPGNATGSVQVSIHSTSSATAGGTRAASSGFILGNRSGANALQGSINGALVNFTANPNPASVAPNDHNLYLGRTSETFFNAGEYAIFGVTNVSLTTQDHEDLFNIFDAYMTVALA